MNLDVDDSTLLHISWKNIYNGAAAVAKFIHRNEPPAVIITTQEDAIPAALVCNATNIPLCIAHLISKQNGIILDCIPKIGAPIHSGVYQQSPPPPVMVFSTLNDNSNSRNVDEIASHYRKLGHSVNTSCIYSRKLVDNPPDYAWVKLTLSTKCSFPWQE